MPQGADDIAGRPIETLRLQHRPERYGKSERGAGGEIRCKVDPVNPWKAGTPMRGVQYGGWPENRRRGARSFWAKTLEFQHESR